MGSLQGLNQQQQQAVAQIEGPLLIIAGPGTGKTKTLTARIIHLLEDAEIKSKEAVALTFTNKAAREIKERLRNEGGLETIPKVATFHALGLDILKRQNNNLKLVTEGERREIIRSIAKPKKLRHMNLHELEYAISSAKSALRAQVEKEMQDVIVQYEKMLTDIQCYDFDDLLIKTYQLLQVEEAKRPVYSHILVDEFQDTSELQYEMLKLLCPPGNICVIGDPNQSIYAFRGAGQEMFQKFRKDFPDAREITLIQNYRSGPEIVTLANSIFPGSPQLQTSSESSGSVKALQTLNEYSEASYIINEIENGIGGSDMLKAIGDQIVYEPRDYAVLYRTRNAAQKIQRAFADSGIPYQVAGEGSPYESAELQAIITIMNYIAQPDDRRKEAIRRLPTLNNPSPPQLEALLVKLLVNDHTSVASLANGIAETFSLFPARGLQQFLNMLIQFGTGTNGLKAAIKHIEEIAASEFYDPSINAVTLLTIHAAKGLEFTAVFLGACEEGIMPKHGNGLQENLDEERRLFYVAVTRAKERLDILYTKKRAAKPTTLSRFVSELPETIVPRELDPNMAILEKRLQKKQQKRAQASLF